MPRYAIIDAPGHYGSRTRVYRVFATLAEADGYAQRGGCAVISAELEEGAVVLAVDAVRWERRADAERTEFFAATRRRREQLQAANRLHEEGRLVGHADLYPSGR